MLIVFDSEDTGFNGFLDRRHSCKSNVDLMDGGADSIADTIDLLAFAYSDKIHSTSTIKSCFSTEKK